MTYRLAQFIAVILLLMTLLFVASVIADTNERVEQSGVFSLLKIGQAVQIVANSDGSVTVKTFDDAPLPYKVVSIGENFITVDDPTGMVRTTYPIYSIKSISKTTLNRSL